MIELGICVTLLGAYLLIVFVGLDNIQTNASTSPYFARKLKAKKHFLYTP